MKKTLAILLALVLVLSLATSAMAASITITPPDTNGGTEAGITYTAYKIFDATITYNDDGSIKNVSYTIDSKNNPYYATIAAATEYFKLTQVDGTDIYVVEKLDAYTEEVANTFADKLKAVDATASGSTNTLTDGKYTISGLTDGYYLVTSSVGSDLILDTIGDISIATKNEYPTLDKKVENAVSTTANMGDDLNFSITVNIPEDAVGEIVVHDNMTGLEYQKWTSIEGIIVSTENLSDECEVHFTLTSDYVASNKGKSIVINYIAKVTADVANNEAWLVDDSYKSALVNTNVYSTDLVINKVVKGTNNSLSGAEFVLAKLNDDNTTYSYYKVDENGNVSWVAAQDSATKYTTGEDGMVEFENLKDGTYYLFETVAPAGYNRLTAPVEVTVTAKTETVEIEGVQTTQVKDATLTVENSSGTELPTTGGVGTTLFYIFGGILVVGAVVLLVTKKRMSVA